MTTAVDPSPEVRAMIKRWCDIQRNKYGDDWKKILAAEMAEQTTPFLEALVELRKLGK